MNADGINELAALDAEHALIGALLLDNSAWDRIGERVKTEYFFSETSRMVYAEIARQLGTGKPCDVITVATALGDRSSLAEIHALATYVPSSANIRRYADTVIERHKSRMLMVVSSELTELAQEHETPIEDRVERAQAGLSKLLDEAPRDDWVGIYEGMTLHTQVLEDRAAGKNVAMSTMLTDLDCWRRPETEPDMRVVPK